MELGSSHQGCTSPASFEPPETAPADGTAEAPTSWVLCSVAKIWLTFGEVNIKHWDQPRSWNMSQVFKRNEIWATTPKQHKID